MTTLVTRNTTPTLLTPNATNSSGSELSHDQLDSNFYPIANITNGTAKEDRALVVDANKDIAGIRNLGATTYTGGLASGVTAVTQAAGTNATSVATTAFVETATEYKSQFTTLSGADPVILTPNNDIKSEIWVYYRYVSSSVDDKAVSLQVGSASGYLNSGYDGICSSNISTATNLAAQVGFTFTPDTLQDAETYVYGHIHLLKRPAQNVWWADGSATLWGTASTNATAILHGQVSLSGALTGMRVINTGGAGTFDSGSVQVFWK